MANNISPQAYVNPAARLGDNVTIYPFAYIEGDVQIGDGCVIYPYVSLMDGTRLGKNNNIHQGTVLAALPQNFDYCGEKTELVIGDNNTIRENVVINRATHSTGKTIIGNGNFIMEGVHISHDTVICDKCVIGYGTKIAGDCIIQNNAILSSNVVANPATRVGVAAMVQSGCRFSKDVPPYIVATHNPIEYGGVHSVILSNIGISEDVQNNIAQAYRLIFNGMVSVFDALNQVRDQVPDSPEIQNIIQFAEESKRGLISKM